MTLVCLQDRRTRGGRPLCDIKVLATEAIKQIWLPLQPRQNLDETMPHKMKLQGQTVNLQFNGTGVYKRGNRGISLCKFYFSFRNCLSPQAAVIKHYRLSSLQAMEIYFLQF
jgi:hypothetical protein